MLELGRAAVDGVAPPCTIARGSLDEPTALAHDCSSLPPPSPPSHSRRTAGGAGVRVRPCGSEGHIPGSAAQAGRLTGATRSRGDSLVEGRGGMWAIRVMWCVLFVLPCLTIY